MLVAPGDRQVAPLRTIEITVRWLDRGDERSVRRQTYGFDLEAASEILAATGLDFSGPDGGQDNGLQGRDDDDTRELTCSSRGGRSGRDLGRGAGRIEETR